MRFNILILLFLLLQQAYVSNAQSTAIIYNENFNSGTGGWVIGGFNPSWSYGIPSLPNIASNGTNCFVTGDAGAATTEPFAGCLTVTGPTATGNFYNCCERSYVESPVINLTGVGSPLLSLDINLHCEQTFDGAKVQISLNGGQSWQDVGTYTASNYLIFPNLINCREQNWYNKNNINYLTGTAGGCGIVNYSFGGGNSGWSGGCAQSASGACLTNDIHGTGGWITATHCIPQAANQSSCKVRIAFGSGSQVYSDGIAFDNVKILDVFPVVSFSGNPSPGCGPIYEFINNTDCGQSWNWNFGHSGSSGNSSTAQNPVHEFPAPGSYTITLSATDFCGGTASFSQPVNVNAGTAPVISGITPTETLLCDSASGVITITLSAAGIPPYEISYLFDNTLVSISGQTGNPILLSGLPPGNYDSFSISDSNGCADFEQTQFVLPFNYDNLIIETSGDTLILPGNEITLEVSANIPSTFIWSPSNTLDDPFSSNPVAAPLVTTNYSVTATDTNGCVANSQVTVFIDETQPCDQYYFPNSFTPNADGKNDFFQLYSDPSMNLETFKMTIFDRWGKKVFQTEVTSHNWNGKSMPEGIYIVIADFKCRNKKTSRYSGTLNLIR